MCARTRARLCVLQLQILIKHLKLFFSPSSHEIRRHPAEVDHDFPELRTSAVQAHEVSGNTVDVDESADALRVILVTTPLADSIIAIFKAVQSAFLQITQRISSIHLPFCMCPLEMPVFQDVYRKSHLNTRQASPLHLSAGSDTRLSALCDLFLSAF